MFKTNSALKGVLQLNYVKKKEDNINLYVFKKEGSPLIGHDLFPILRISSKLETENQSMNFVKLSNAAKEIKTNYPQVISSENYIGKYNKETINIELKENLKLIYIGTTPIPYTLKKFVEKEINRLLKMRNN